MLTTFKTQRTKKSKQVREEGRSKTGLLYELASPLRFFQGNPLDPRTLRFKWEMEAGSVESTN